MWRYLIDKELDFNLLFNTVEDFILVLDYESNILKANHAILEKLGYTIDEILNMNVLDIHRREDREAVILTINEMIKGNLDTCTLPIISKRGEVIPVNTKTTLGKWGEKDIIFGISRDISEIKKIQDDLIEAKRFLSNIFTSIQDGISVLDKDLNIIKVNPTAERWYSVSMPVIGKKCYEVYH
ncbi:MAG: PAS domain S-box protein [Candidatus Lokiarchaeota archaeon]|nr:PAS domain S-box protein [Candidatus Lokiarchaeota archaeon]